MNAVGVLALGRFVQLYSTLLTKVGGSYGSSSCMYTCRCVVSLSACVGRTEINICPFVTDIVYVPPPFKRSFGCDR